MTISVNKKWRKSELFGTTVHILDCNGQDTYFYIDNKMPDGIIEGHEHRMTDFTLVADSIFRFVFSGKGTGGTWICNLDTMYNVIDYAEDLYFRSCMTIDDARKG